MDKPPPKRAIARRAGILPAALTPADEVALAAAKLRIWPGKRFYPHSRQQV
jgi:hypothetical protein